jgi:hypothetical protein
MASRLFPVLLLLLKRPACTVPETHPAVNGKINGVTSVHIAVKKARLYLDPIQL